MAVLRAQFSVTPAVHLGTAKKTSYLRMKVVCLAAVVEIDRTDCRSELSDPAKRRRQLLPEDLYDRRCDPTKVVIFAEKNVPAFLAMLVRCLTVLTGLSCFVEPYAVSSGST
jgi:hypothetical protein